MSKIYKAAVIGCGRIGVLMEKDPKRIKPATHAGAFFSSPFTELSALVDVNYEQLKKAQAIFPKVATYTDIGEMLNIHRPDIVAIATPPDQHRQVVEICAEFGVPVIICEKPVASTIEEAVKIINICKKKGSLLFINHTRRFDKLLQQVSDRIKKEELGTLSQISCYYTAGLFNTGTHMIDLVRFITKKEIQWVCALQEHRFTAPAEDINANGLLILEGNIPVSLQCLEVKDYAIFDIHLYGSKGYLEINRFGFSVEFTSVIDCIDFEGYRELDIFNKKRLGKSRSFFANMVEHIVDCIEKRAIPISSGEDGLRALIVLFALKKSALENGKLINVKEEEQKIWQNLHF